MKQPTYWVNSVSTASDGGDIPLQTFAADTTCALRQIAHYLWHKANGLGLTLWPHGMSGHSCMHGILRRLHSARLI